MSLKKTKVSALAGRVIESVTIFAADDAEGDQEFRGPSLEIRVMGGYIFTFTATAKPMATTQLGKQKKNGDYDFDDHRTFE